MKNYILTYRTPNREKGRIHDVKAINEEQARSVAVDLLGRAAKGVWKPEDFSILLVEEIKHEGENQHV